MMELRVQRERKGRRRWIVGVLLLGALVWGFNHFLFSNPAVAALAAEARTSGMAISSHLRWYVDPATLVLDLKRADVPESADLFRGLLRAVKAVDDATWMPGGVVLLRDGKPVYTISGADLSKLAYQFGVSRNPNAVLVALVQALRLPDGQPLPPTAVGDAADRWGQAR